MQGTAARPRNGAPRARDASDARHASVHLLRTRRKKKLRSAAEANTPPGVRAWHTFPLYLVRFVFISVLFRLEHFVCLFTWCSRYAALPATRHARTFVFRLLCCFAEFRPILHFSLFFFCANMQTRHTTAIRGLKNEEATFYALSTSVFPEHYMMTPCLTFFLTKTAASQRGLLRRPSAKLDESALQDTTSDENGHQ